MNGMDERSGGKEGVKKVEDGGQGLGEDRRGAVDEETVELWLRQPAGSFYTLLGHASSKPRPPCCDWLADDGGRREWMRMEKRRKNYPEEQEQKLFLKMELANIVF